MNNESASGIAVIRPPGHHAENDIACGFCIFNSVAIGANYALNKFGLKRYADNTYINLTVRDIQQRNGVNDSGY